MRGCQNRFFIDRVLTVANRYFFPKRRSLALLVSFLLGIAVICSAPALSDTDLHSAFSANASEATINPAQPVATVNDGYFTAGGISSDSGNRLYLLKTDIDGNAVWCKKTDMGNKSIGAGAVMAVDDGYLVTGSVAAANGTSIYLLKTDLTGNTIWTKTWGEPNRSNNVFSMVATGDGYVISGQYPIKNEFHDAVGRIVLTKTDLQGNPLWYKDYDGPGMAAGRSVIALSDGYLVAGDTYYGEDTSDIYLLRTDLDGNMLWNRTFLGPIEDGSSTIAVPGGYLVVGSSWGPHAMYPEECTVNLLRTDLNGTEIWEKTYLVSPGYDMGKSVLAVDGGFVIAGISNMYSNRTLFLLKIDDSGSKVWNKAYLDFNLSKISSSPFQPGTVSMVAGNSGYVVIGGENLVRNSWFNSSIYILRTDLSGNLTWIRTYDDIVLAEDDYIRPLTPLPTLAASSGNSGGSIAISRGIPLVAVNDGFVAGGRVRFANGSHEGESGIVYDFTDYPYLLKTDLQGSIDWVRVYDKIDNSGGNNGEIRSIAATTDGYLLAISSGTSNGSNIRVLKTDPDGNLLWTKTYGDPEHSYSVYSVTPVGDGYLLAGLSLSVPGDLPSHNFLMMIDPVGDLVWFRYCDEIGLSVHSLTAVRDGYVLAGAVVPEREVVNAGLFKTDVNGSKVWDTTLNSSTTQNTGPWTEAYSVAAVKDGYAVAGLSWGHHPMFESANSGAYVFKTDLNGSLAWDRKYLVSGGVDSAYSMAAVKDGYMVAGIADKYGQVYNQSHIFILKANPNGYPEWNVTFTSTADDYVSAVIALSDGYLVAGQNNLRGESGKINQSLHLIRTDMSGNVVWDKTYADFTLPAARTGEEQPAPTLIVIVTPTPAPTATPAVNVTPVQVPSPSPPATPAQTPGFGSALTTVALAVSSMVMLSRSFYGKGGDRP